MLEKKIQEEAMSKERYISECLSCTRPSFFIGKNYYLWKENMKLFLRSQDVDIWKVIADGNHVPTIPRLLIKCKILRPPCLPIFSITSRFTITHNMGGKLKQWKELLDTKSFDFDVKELKKTNLRYHYVPVNPNLGFATGT